MEECEDRRKGKSRYPENYTACDVRQQPSKGQRMSLLEVLESGLESFGLPGG